jgi:NADPH:quinone reductase-like Zn-dependent oxidoreductase
MTAFAVVIDQVTTQPMAESGADWLFHVSGEDVAGQVQAAGAHVATDAPGNYAFISLRAA